MWVIIRGKIPWTAIEDGHGSFREIEPPPYASVHWAVPWPHSIYVKRQERAAALMKDEIAPDDDYVSGPLGVEPNWARAVKVRWQEADLRLMPNEFNEMKTEGLLPFLSQAYEFVPGDVAAANMVKERLSGESRPIFEAALLDGCDRNEAMMVSLGQDIFAARDVPEPMGWYRLLPEMEALL